MRSPTSWHWTCRRWPMEPREAGATPRAREAKPHRRKIRRLRRVSTDTVAARRDDPGLRPYRGPEAVRALTAAPMPGLASSFATRQRIGFSSETRASPVTGVASQPAMLILPGLPALRAPLGGSGADYADRLAATRIRRRR